MSSANRFLFFVIIGLAVLITVAALTLERLGIYTLPSRSVERITITVAVPAELSDWAKEAADAFNSRNNDADVNVIAVKGLAAIQQFKQALSAEQPHLWIPEATFVAAIAQEEGLSYTVTDEGIANTQLAWGAFQSRADALGALDWPTIHDAAVTGSWSQLGGDASWGFFKLTMASPSTSSEGLGALISAAASYHDSNTLTSSMISDPSLAIWMKETVDSVPNFSTLGPDPAESLATRGASVGDVGFLSMAAWNRSQNGLNSAETFVIRPAAYVVVLDYPIVLRSNSSAEEMQMAERFSSFLQQRNGLEEVGLSQDRSAASTVEIDGQAALTLLKWAERERVGQ